jgi:cullin 1
LLRINREFYAKKAEAWITEDPTPAYLIKAEKAIEEEKARVLAYLNVETETKLLRVLEEEVG